MAEQPQPLLQTENPESSGLQIWVMICVMLGTGTVSINNSSFNPAIPQLMHDFQINETAVSWVMVIFLLSMSLSLLLTGYVSQRFGKRQVYLTALTVFGLSSLYGAFAGHFGTVLLVRALQGFSSGLMIPLSLGIIFMVTPPAQRGAATGLWGAMIMLTLACGPMLGALVLVWWNWQVLFLLNVPLAICALVMGLRWLPSQQTNLRLLRFDWSGFVLLAVGIVALLLSLSKIQQLSDIQTSEFLLLFSTGIAACCGFFWFSRNKPNALIDWQLFTSSGFNYSVIISVVHTIGLFITLLLIPLLLQNTLKLSPVWTGLILMSSALTTSLCSQWAGKYLDQHGARQLICFGLLLTVAAFAGLALIPGTHVISLMFCMILHGLGFGLSYMPATTAGLNSLEDQELVTQGAAVNNLLRRICAAIAVVVAALYLQIRTHNIPYLPEPAIAQIHAIRELFLICAGVMLLALPAAWRFPSQKQADVLVQNQ